MSNGSTKNLIKSENFAKISQFSCFLVDNGSLRAEPTLNLRRIAIELGGRLGIPVHPVSLLHSSKVNNVHLEGIQANLLEDSLRAYIQFPESQPVLVLPLFFGPSRALTEYIPKILAKLSREVPSLDIRLANCLLSHNDDSSEFMARILLNRLQEVSQNFSPGDQVPQVVLVDHGSAVQEVLHVRQLVSRQLKQVTIGKYDYIGDCSMENPQGAEKYNNRLLSDLLSSVDPNIPVILSQLFFSNGRHAGKDGDIEKICRSSGHTAITLAQPILNHPYLIDLLILRAIQAVQ